MTQQVRSARRRCLQTAFDAFDAACKSLDAARAAYEIALDVRIAGRVSAANDAAQCAYEALERASEAFTVAYGTASVSIAPSEIAPEGSPVDALARNAANQAYDAALAALQAANDCDIAYEALKAANAVEVPADEGDHDQKVQEDHQHGG